MKIIRIFLWKYQEKSGLEFNLKKKKNKNFFFF